jgi:hypothetical protein
MTTFTSQLLGIDKLDITAVSEVASGVAPAVDFHLVVDVSASMGIGASASRHPDNGKHHRLRIRLPRSGRHDRLR